MGGSEPAAGRDQSTVSLPAKARASVGRSSFFIAMKAAVTRLRGLARGPETRRWLADLALAYAGVAAAPRGASPWDKLTLDRTDARWRELVDLARLLLGDRFQTTSGGGGRGFSLLFDMNRLFEAYVAKMLTRALAGGDLRAAVQGGGLFCLTRIGADGTAGGGCFQARPDILVKRGDDTLLIIDAKWKRLGPRIDAAQGVAAIHAAVDAGYRVCVYTQEERRFVLASCLAAGATGVVSKSSTLAETRTAFLAVSRGELVAPPSVTGLIEALVRRGRVTVLNKRQREVLAGRARGLAPGPRSQDAGPGAFVGT